MLVRVHYPISGNKPDDVQKPRQITKQLISVSNSINYIMKYLQAPYLDLKVSY